MRVIKIMSRVGKRGRSTYGCFPQPTYEKGSSLLVMLLWLSIQATPDTVITSQSTPQMPFNQLKEKYPVVVTFNN